MSCLSQRLHMEKDDVSIMRSINQKLGNFIRNGFCKILSVGPIPNHVAFIMNGNRRYEKNLNMVKGTGHQAGLMAMISMLKHCCDLGIRYITVYAFSIDNFKRKKEEVERVMELLKFTFELMSQNNSIANIYSIKFQFSGNLELLSEPVKDAATELMAKSAENSKFVFTFCIAYTSTDEIVHAIEGACEEKRYEGDVKKPVKAVDIEKHMYMAIAPDPDIVVRTAGEYRLSNFMLWQTTCSDLQSTPTLWPEIKFCDLVLAVLKFQRNYRYLDKKKVRLQILL